MSLSLKEARAKLASHFADGKASEPDRWSALWDKGDFLPWDQGKPNPAFTDILTGRQDLIGSCTVQNHHGETQRKTALVPGCGRGYDVLLLASFGYNAFGLEVSETAIKGCLDEQRINGANYPVINKAIGPGRAIFIKADFFNNSWMHQMEVEKFDLIYDYTFLSAFPPSMRPRWASRMTELLEGDGCLVCLEFPSNKDPKIGGPPYALPPSTYVEHLGHPGVDLAYSDDGHIKEDHHLAENPAGLKRIAHWKPQRTHEIGKGQDWVSVWKHPSSKIAST